MLRIRGRADRWNSAKKVREGARGQRVKARAEGLTGQTRVAQQPSPGINAPGGSFVLVQLVAPSSLSTTCGYRRDLTRSGIPSAVCIGTGPVASSRCAEQAGGVLGRS